MNFLTNTLMKLKQAAVCVQVQSVRFRYHSEKLAQGKLMRRFGYKETMLERGTLPHVDGTRLPMPYYRPRDFWNEKRSVFGQNDYIDILGNENLHPTKILYDVPLWLRGFQGNEYQHCLRKVKMLRKGAYRYENPTKWHQLEKRVKFLYRYMNFKTKTGYTNKKSG